MDFLDEVSLKEAIVEGVQSAVNDTLETVKWSHKTNVADIVYGRDTPSEYNRTYDMADAWEVQSLNDSFDVSAEVYYNSDLLSVSSADYQHWSVVQHTDVRPYMASIIFQGAGPAFGHGYWTLPRNAWQATDNWLSNTKLRSLMENGMTSANLPWKRSTGAIVKTSIK